MEKYRHIPWLAALLLGGCATPSHQSNDAVLAIAKLMNANGHAVGAATIASVGGVPTLSLSAKHIPAGPHGVHLHAVGKCEAPAFASAGGHLNPGSRQHGVDNPHGAHLGDLPNLLADTSDAGSLTATLHKTIPDLLAQLFDADDTAVVIHASADDYRTDPSGNSGSRIACGVFTRP